MRVIEEKNGVSFEWDSYEDFIVDRKRVEKNYPHYIDRHIIESADVDWIGTRTYKEFVDKLENGWPELREQLVSMLSDMELDVPLVTNNIITRRRKRVRRDHGDTIDMQRVYNGHLDTAWEVPVRTEHVAVNNKRITLAFDICSSCAIDNSDAMWRAALCLLLADKLAAAGRVFEIWVTASARDVWTNGPSRLWQGWCVKSSQDPIVMDRLCAMVSVGYLRTVGFIGMRAHTWNTTDYLGYPANEGLPATLRKRQEDGEAVLRIGECYSKYAVIQEYERARKEIEEHSARYAEQAGSGV